MANSVMIMVGVSIPGNYQIRAKADGRRLSIHGWDVSGSEALKSRSGWLERCTVVDAAEGDPLPDTLFIIARCYREWEGRIGGSSWYATEAFVSQENALAYMEHWESELNWQWIVSSRRVGDSSL